MKLPSKKDLKEYTAATKLALGQLRDRMNAAYLQDKRGFIEVVLGFSLGGLLAYGLGSLYSIWPFPGIPPIIAGESPHAIIQSQTPQIQHILALTGLFILYVGVIRITVQGTIHWTISFSLKVLKLYRTFKFRKLDEERLL